MAEFEELKLSVSLVDNASQGLATLRENLRSLGGSENRNALARMMRDVERVDRQMTSLRAEAGRTAAGVTFLGRTIAGAITTFGTAFVSHFALDSLRNFTDEMVKLDGIARQIGVAGVTVKSLVDQMKLMGIDAGAAQNAVTSFTAALADMSRQGSQVRQELMKGAISDPGAMAAFIQRLTGFASRGEMAQAFNEIVETANNVFEQELARTGGNEIVAAEHRNRFLKTLGLDANTIVMIKEKFKEVTEAEKAEHARRLAISQTFSKEMAVMDLKSQEFIRGLQEGLLGPIQEINAAIGLTGESWGKLVGEGVGQFVKDISSIVKTFQLVREGKWGEALKLSLGFEFDIKKSAIGGLIGSTAEKPTDPVQQQSQPRRAHPGMPAAPPPGFQRMSYSPGGGQPIIVPGGDAGYSRSGGQTEFTRAIRTGVFEALVDFRNFTATGGGGGFQRASLTTGDAPGGGSYGGTPGTGNVARNQPSGSSVGPGSGPGAGETPPNGPGASGSGAAGNAPLFDPVTGKLGGGLGEPRPGGRRHQGDDISAAVGTAVHSSKAGVVDRVGTDNWGTPVVTVKHPDGTYTRYMHLSQVGVKPGDQLEGGQELGKSGTANKVPHLHYEIWQGKPNAAGSRMLNPREVHGWNNKTNQPQAQRAVPGTGDAPPATAKAPENAPAAPTAAAPQPDDDPHAGHSHGPPPKPGKQTQGELGQRLAGLQSVMDEARSTGLETTSGYRDPTHKLSRRNPRSAHAQALAFDTRAHTTAQVDAAMAKQREMFAARGMVEGRDYKFIDEVRRPSGHATGPHLHTQLTPEGMRRYQENRVAETEARRKLVEDADARRKMDADLGGEAKMKSQAYGRFGVKVTAPPGTKVEAKGEGAFTKTEVERSTPLPPSRGGGNGGEAESVSI